MGVLRLSAPLPLHFYLLCLLTATLSCVPVGLSCFFCAIFSIFAILSRFSSFLFTKTIILYYYYVCQPNLPLHNISSVSAQLNRLIGRWGNDPSILSLVSLHFSPLAFPFSISQSTRLWRWPGTRGFLLAERERWLRWGTHWSIFVVLKVFGECIQIVAKVASSSHWSPRDNVSVHFSPTGEDGLKNDLVPYWLVYMDVSMTSMFIPNSSNIPRRRPSPYQQCECVRANQFSLWIVLGLLSYFV